MRPSLHPRSGPFEDKKGKHVPKDKLQGSRRADFPLSACAHCAHAVCLQVSARLSLTQTGLRQHLVA